MNQTHIHLIITHLPIYGAFLGFIVLLRGVWIKSSETVSSAYIILLISAIGAAIAYYTGEAAEETVEGITGILESNVEEHEEAGELTFYSMMLLGVLSIAGLLAQSLKSARATILSMIILIVNFACVILSARTGYLGGLIRHTEINNSNQGTVPPAENSHDDD